MPSDKQSHMVMMKMLLLVYDRNREEFFLMVSMSEMMAVEKRNRNPADYFVDASVRACACLSGNMRF